MNLRQRLLNEHTFSCVICGKRVTEEDDAIVVSASSQIQTPIHGLAYKHKTCEGKKMKKSNLAEKTVVTQKQKTMKATKPKTTKATKTKSTRISKSGKFTSIRHLMEETLKKNKSISFEDAAKIVLKEYPNSAFKQNHLAWYKSRIITLGETKTR